MGTGTNGHLGAKRHFWNDEQWGRWAFGENGHLGLMGTRKNEHQGKSAIEANGHFGIDEHWGEWALGENGHQEKRAPKQMGIGQLGQMSSLGKWEFG